VSSGSRSVFLRSLREQIFQKNLGSACFRDFFIRSHAGFEVFRDIPVFPVTIRKFRLSQRGSARQGQIGFSVIRARCFSQRLKKLQQEIESERKLTEETQRD
jgi:hypothetical protein